MFGMSNRSHFGLTSAARGVFGSPPHRRFATSPAHPRSRIVSVFSFLTHICIFLASLCYIVSTLIGVKNFTSPRTDTWEYCASQLRAIDPAGIAPVVWQQSMRALDNVNAAQPQVDSVALQENALSCRCLTPTVYEDAQPKISAIVQSFNHRQNIHNITAALKSGRHIEEIVISEDGSTDGSLAAWRAALPDPNHFVIRSNNLHELRSYNRAMRLAAGDIVLLLQDDDLLPQDDDWIERAVQLFDSKPNLGLLGGYIGQLWDHSSGKGFEYGEQRSTHGGLRRGNTAPIMYMDNSTSQPFMYVECVWIAPMFARRSLLRRAGGLELSLAKVGEPGMWQDCIFSFEAWVNGYTVGVYDARFYRGVGGHGSAATPDKVKQRELVWKRAVAYANRKYSRSKIHDLVVNLNARSMVTRDTSHAQVEE